MLATRPVQQPWLDHTLKNGRYRCLRELTVPRHGLPYSRVYQALDEHTNQTVVLKCPNPALPPGKLAFARHLIAREQVIVGRLTHPQIPALRDNFTGTNGAQYLVLDYIEGWTIEELLVGWGGRAPVAMALFIGIEVCQVLEYLHEQVPHVIHRDIKPGNIILTPDGEVTVFDFGIAHCCLAPGSSQQNQGMWSGDSLSITRFGLGSYGHAAPEQYDPDGQITPRTDLFGVGVLLHQMLSGEDPAKKSRSSLFSFPTLRQPELFATTILIARLLRHDVRQRPPHARFVREQLEKALLPYCMR